MKYLINNSKFSIFGEEKRFPIALEKIKRLQTGTFGCFGYPNGNVLVAVWQDEEGKEKNQIIGRFESSKVKRSHFFAGVIQSVTLLNFESEFTEQDVLKVLNKAEKGERV